MNIVAGRINVEREHYIWYRCVENDGIPLLILHGGPGAGHDYLEPLESLGADRPVILYDQLGCGKSDQPDDRSLWRMERFVAEVDILRQALDLEQVHLFGHSWGGWLAIEYMLTRPSGVISLILASTSASVPQFGAEASRLKAKLPPDVYETILHNEATEAFHSAEYEAAVAEFYKRHLCRLTEPPESLNRSGANIAASPVYEVMNGPNEFVVIGNLKHWDRTARLGEITTPTLITVGRYDEMTPACAETLRQGILDAQLVIFEESAHMAHLEETEKYLQAVSDFLARVEHDNL